MAAPQLATNLWSVLGTGTGLGGGDPNTTAEDLQQTLAFAKRFDPNASIGWTDAGNQYVNFNNALMPKNVLGGHGIEGIARMPGSGERLVAPNATAMDPIFGQITTPQNLREKGPSMVDILGPLLVGAATMGGGLAGLAPGMAAGGFDLAGSGAFAAGGSGTFGAGFGSGFSGSLSSTLQRALTQGGRTLSGMGQKPTITPQQMLLLRLLSMRNQGGG